MSALIRGSRLQVTGLIFAAGLLPTSAYGQLEEIVVTARKRDETLTTVPLAVTAWSAAALERSNSLNLQDLAAQTPGMSFSQQGGQVPGRYNTAIRFRGMDTNLSKPSQQLGTAFLDGVYIANGVGSLDFSNVERVEVVKGPQSAQFGRSTFAGAVNYITKTPSTTRYSGRISGQIASAELYDVNAAHEGPIVPNILAYRVAVRAYGDGGQYKSTSDGGALGREQTRSVMATLFLDQTRFTAKAGLLYARDNDGAPAAVLLAGPGRAPGAGPALTNSAQFTGQTVSPAGLSPNPASPYFVGGIDSIIKAAGYRWDQLTSINSRVPSRVASVFCTDTFPNSINGARFTKPGGVPQKCNVGRKASTLNANLSLNYTFDAGIMDGATLTSLTGYGFYRTSYIRDFDLSGALNWFAQDPQNFRSVSQEVRLTSSAERRVRYSLGASYFDVKYLLNGEGGYVCWDCGGTLTAADPNADLGTRILFGGTAAAIPGPPWYGAFGTFPTETGETLSIFGSLGAEIVTNLTVDFEWRYQRDKIGQIAAGQTTAAITQTFKNFLPRATLSYKLTPQSVTWFTYSKGNLPGTFNSTLVGQPQSVVDQVRQAVGTVGLFNEEEELNNFELGLKHSFIDNRAYVSAVAYRMKWNNLKTRQNVAVILPNGSATFLNIQANAGAATLTGLELEGSAQVSEQLSLTGNLSIAGSKFDRFQCAFSPYVAQANAAGLANCTGNRAARYPKWSGSFSALWTQPISGSWNAFVRADGQYFGKAFSEEPNFSWYGDTWRFNAGIGVQSDQLRLEVFVRNLFDNSNAASAARVSDFSQFPLLNATTRMAIAVTPPEKRRFGVRATYNF